MRVPADRPCATLADSIADGRGPSPSRTAANILEALNRLRPERGELQLAFHHPTEDRL